MTNVGSLCKPLRLFASGYSMPARSQTRRMFRLSNSTSCSTSPASNSSRPLRPLTSNMQASGSSRSKVCREEVDFRLFPREPDHALERHAEFFEHANRAGVVGVHDGVEARLAEHVARVSRRGRGRLERVALPAEP